MLYVWNLSLENEYFWSNIVTLFVEYQLLWKCSIPKQWKDSVRAGSSLRKDLLQAFELLCKKRRWRGHSLLFPLKRLIFCRYSLRKTTQIWTFQKPHQDWPKKYEDYLVHHMVLLHGHLNVLVMLQGLLRWHLPIRKSCIGFLWVYENRTLNFF